MTLKEKVNENSLLRLLACDELNENQKSKLLKYKNKINSGLVSVNYFYSKKIPIEKGRLFAEEGLSYQSFERKIRHTLAKDIYYDIDMVNAAPTLLKQYCNKNNIKCPMLANYVNKKDVWFEEIMQKYCIDRLKAKKLIIKLMFGGKYKLFNDDSNDYYEPEEKIKKVVDFQNEMICISDKIYNIETKLVEQIKKCKNTVPAYKIKRSVMSLKTNIIENDCVQEAKNFFQERQFKVDCLCFDGFMIEKKYVDKKLLEECSKQVFNKIGYNVKFENKPMDEFLSLPQETAFVKKDIHVQEKLFRLVNPNYFKFCQGTLYIFSETSGKFEICDQNNPIQLNHYLIKFKKYFNKENKRCTDITEFKNYGEEKDLLSKPIYHVINASKDDNWLFNTSQTSLGYLLFKDGIYDMRTNIFKNEFDPNIVFHHGIPHTFPQRNEEDIKYAYNTSFNEICWDNYDNKWDNGWDWTKMDKTNYPSSMPFRVALARALAGNIEAKKFYLCPGKTNAGKSKLVDMFMSCFGGFVQTFNAENLAYKNETPDEGQKNRWMYLIRFGRIIFSNEVNMRAVLNGNDIKKVSAGGDKLIGRTHCKEEVQFVPHFTAFCMMNDIPPIEPMDEAVIKRLVYYEFKRQFIMRDDTVINDNSNNLKNDVNDKLSNKCNLKKRGIVRINDKNNSNNIKVTANNCNKNPVILEKYQIWADSKLEEKIREDRFINGFIHLVLDSYQYFLKYGQPRFNEEAKSSWTSDNNKEEQIIELIKDEYEITNDNNDQIKVSDFNLFKKNNSKVFSSISDKKIYEILEKMGVTKGRGKMRGERVLLKIKEAEILKYNSSEFNDNDNDNDNDDNKNNNNNKDDNNSNNNNE